MSEQKLILSLDGGGIRGAATIQFLSRVEQQLNHVHGKSIRDLVDMYAGTSTGSIIALALATTELSVSAINDLYNYENSQVIFSKNKRRRCWIRGICTPKYRSSGKTQRLAAVFGTRTLANVRQGRHVLVATYGIQKRVPVIIKSTKKEHLGLLSATVADASSAAPTFFPTRRVTIPPDSDDEDWLIDGGVVVNDPAMCAISETRRQWKTEISQIRTLSIGTGYLTKKIKGPPSRGWGTLQWFVRGKILDVVRDERIVAYQASRLLQSGHYIRVNAELRRQYGLSTAPDDSMDDVSRANIKKLRVFGDFLFDHYGDSVVDFVRGTYQGPSLDRVDPVTGTPRKVC